MPAHTNSVAFSLNIQQRTVWLCIVVNLLIPNIFLSLFKALHQLHYLILFHMTENVEREIAEVRITQKIGIKWGNLYIKRNNLSIKRGEIFSKSHSSNTRSTSFTRGRAAATIQYYQPLCTH